MKHLFIPYPLAVLAKEKGFDEQFTLAYYNSGKELCNGINMNEPINNSLNCRVGNIVAPLYQQIVDWFREKHDIHIWATPWYEIYPKQKLIGYIINGESETTFHSYYEALDKAIEEAFKLI